MKESMFVKCIQECFFGDYIKEGKLYKVLEVKDGGFHVLCEDGVERFMYSTLFTKPLTLYVFDK